MIVARPLWSKAGTSHRTRTLLPLKAEITPSQMEYPQRTNSGQTSRADTWIDVANSQLCPGNELLSLLETFIALGKCAEEEPRQNYRA
jgi:hypothetical protein